MGRSKSKKSETPEALRARLVAELRLFGHKEAAKLLEDDGAAGEFVKVYGTWGPNAKAEKLLKGPE